MVGRHLEATAWPPLTRGEPRGRRAALTAPAHGVLAPHPFSIPSRPILIRPAALTVAHTRFCGAHMREGIGNPSLSPRETLLTTGALVCFMASFACRALVWKKALFYAEHGLTSTNASYVRGQPFAAGRYLQVVRRSHTTRATVWRTNGARRVTRGEAGASIVGKGHRGRARGRTTSKAVEFVKCSRAVKKSLFFLLFSTCSQPT